MNAPRLWTALLVIASGIAGFAIAEVAVRVALPSPSARHWDRAEVPEVGASQLGGETVEGESNSLGLRGPEVPIANDGSFRILALGDSFTYGYKLTNASSWPKLLEGFLNQSREEEIEVLNGGRPDSDTQWQLGYYRRFGSRLEPDMVLIGFIINDCTHLSSSWDIVKIRRRLDALHREPGGPFTSQFVRRFRAALLERRLSQKTVGRFHRDYAEGSPGLDRCRDAFRAFRDRAKSDGFELVVFLYPMLYRLEPDPPFASIHAKMLAFFRAEGISAYDLTPAFEGRRDTELWVQSDDPHPNREANVIAASRIAEILAASETLPQ